MIKTSRIIIVIIIIFTTQFHHTLTLIKIEVIEHHDVKGWFTRVTQTQETFTRRTNANASRMRYARAFQYPKMAAILFPESALP